MTERSLNSYCLEQLALRLCVNAPSYIGVAFGTVFLFRFYNATLGHFAVLVVEYH